MKVHETEIPGVLIIDTDVLEITGDTYRNV